jgi:hypothetical protein
MNKFPEDFDAGIFVGRTLEMICFAAYQVNFHFGSHISISAETSFTFEKPSAIAQITIPVMQSDLMQLLEHEVSKASVQDQHILTLMFEGGYLLRFSDTAPGVYESYHVYIGDKRIII